MSKDGEDRWAFASSSQLICAALKDSAYISQLSSMLPLNMPPSLKEALSTAIYMLISRVINTGDLSKTPGEEYAGILQVDTLNRRLPTRARNLVYVFGLLLASANLAKYKHKHSRALFAVVSAFHTSLFFWSGAYYEVWKRLLGMRYICHPQQPPRSTGLQLMNVGLMAITLATATLQLYSIYSDKAQDVSKEEMDVGQSSAELNFGKCVLCLETEMGHPSVATCGHVFCWSCAVEWLEQHPWCPLCRKECLPQQLICLY